MDSGLSFRAEHTLVVRKRIYAKRWELVGLGVFIVLALLQTWPLVLSPLSEIPIGSEPEHTVPLLNLWVVWWNADRLASGLSGYWNAPIFYPTEGTFAFSEPQPTTWLMAPVIWITGSRILAYNLYLWLSLVLNGVFAQRLLKEYGVTTWMALWGGMAMVLLPIVNWQIGVIQLVPLWGILWTWTAIERLCREPSLLRGVELGIALGISIVTCVHHGLFLVILLIGAAPTLWRQCLKLRNVYSWLLAVPIALMIAGPFVFQINKVMEKHEFEREPGLVIEQSAKASDYFQAYGGQFIDIKPSEGSWKMLSTGWIKFVLAIIGVVYGLRQLDSRRWSAFLLVTAILAYLLSLGPNFHLGVWQPWWTLVDHVPGFAQVRNVNRFAFFVQMAVVVFAAMGLYGLHQFLRGRMKRPRVQKGLPWAIAFMAFLALVEVYPTRGAMAAIPDMANQHRVWLEYVRTQTPAGHAIACFPFAPGDLVGDFQLTSEWMYLGTFHGVPMVNGYSGYFPHHYDLMREKLTKEFPSEGAFKELFRQKVKFLVLKKPTTEQAMDSDFSVSIGEYWLKRVVQDQLVDVYEVGRTKREPPTVLEADKVY